MVSALHDLLVQSAARLPDKTCLVHGSQSLTFAGLEGQARRLAQVLIDAAVLPGDRVAIHLDKSIPEVVAILGTSGTSCRTAGPRS
jgi:non-ribosomal peptide synthetase component F